MNLNLNFCKDCKHQITILKVDKIYNKCRFKKNNYIYKNGLPIKCAKFKLKNKECKSDLTKEGKK